MVIIENFLWYAAVTIILAYWYLHVVETLPKIRKYRKVYLRDWGFLGLSFTNLIEYKEICLRENESLLWFKVQLYLIYAFVGIILFSVIILIFY